MTGQERLISDIVKLGMRNVIDTHSSGTGTKMVQHGGRMHDGQIMNTDARAAAANYDADRQQLQPGQKRDTGQLARHSQLSQAKQQVMDTGETALIKLQLT